VHRFEEALTAHHRSEGSIYPKTRAKPIVESAAAFGITQDDIATHLGINGDTLRKHYRKELDEGVFKAHMKVGGVILDLALRSKDETVKFRAASFYAARRMGWKETTTQENVGKDGGPIETKDVSAVDVIRARIAEASARLGSDLSEPE
jgi:hypothetical protein